MAEDEGDDQRSIEACTTAQAMIDINAKHLDGLRTQCSTSAELTQHEIRTLEVRALLRCSDIYKYCAIVISVCLADRLSISLLFLSNSVLFLDARY